jgi:nondiscriminating glutamyl-tRNA synthetase
VNAHYLHHASGEQLLAWAGPFLPEAAAALPHERRQALLLAVRGNLATLADLPRELAPFLEGPLTFEDDARVVLDAPAARAVCTALGAELESLAEWSGERFKSAVQSVGRALGVKGRELFQPPRAALTGRTHGPELPVVAELLGRDRSLARLRAAGGNSG